MYKKTSAKDAIAVSLLELCQKKSFQKITIQTIMDNCGFSRKSFYNNFDSRLFFLTLIKILVLHLSLPTKRTIFQWGKPCAFFK